MKVCDITVTTVNGQCFKLETTIPEDSSDFIETLVAALDSGGVALDLSNGSVAVINTAATAFITISPAREAADSKNTPPGLKI